MASIESGVNSAGKVNVNTTYSLEVSAKDSVGNKVGKNQREAIPSTQEALLVAGKNDDIAVMMRVDRKGNTLIGNYIPELMENFEGATVNVQKWTPASTTFVPVQSTLAGYTFNSTALTTVSAVSILPSQRLFSKFPRVPMQFKTRLRHSMVSGAIADFGWGVPATTTLIVPNGTCFRMTNSGAVQGVMTINSVEIAISNVLSTVASNGNTVGAALNMSNSYYTSNYFVYDIIVDDDNAVFTVQDTLTGEIIGKLNLPVPNNQIKMWGATALPVYHRMYNNTAPASAPTFILTEMQVLSLDWNLNPDVAQLAGSLGLSAGRNPFTGAQLENHTNSTAPTSATLSNTAAGYATLGGKWQFAAVAGAVTDYALFGFTVPAGSRFICEGVRIESYNTVVAVATTATVLEWAMGFNSSAVSLATANIVRRQVGVQTFPIAAAVGAAAAPLDITFVTPEVVESGRFVHVILNMPVATGTATEIFRGTVTIKGRFI
jgi:hypothetical protein